MPSYITRGIFRLYNNPGPQAFRFPKSRSQPGAAWRAGDGFSDDEATPDFMFHMTGKHRRKRSRSLSAFRELSLEVDDVAEDTAARVAHSQRRKRRSKVLQGVPHDTVMKDLWPTKENFAESLLIQRPRIMVKESIESTPLISSKSAPTVAAEMRQTIPLKRLASDFENLGKRKCRSWSTHRGQPSSSSTRASWKHDHQVSNGNCMEEGNDPYEQAGDESEQERDAGYGYSQLLAESECGDSGSEALSEDDLSDQDDQDEHMQNTVLDSQPDEVQLSIDDSCEKLIIRLFRLALGQGLVLAELADENLGATLARVDFAQADITSPSATQAAFDKPWPTSVAKLPLTVFHTVAIILAGERTMGTYERSKRVNIDGTQNVVDAAKAAGATIFISTSSASVAHRPAAYWGNPFRRWPKNYFQVIDESDFDEPVRPHSQFFGNYAHTKAIAERIVCDANSPNFRTGSIRPANTIYGSSHGDQIIGKNFFFLLLYINIMVGR
ncbi:hypothetical protein NUW58_g6793 [Xylaria curta]|uniref:Uncharacterized protein n=1 Tax=Xylaria curta TaxID=42375 RepID=A0ACC1NP15_9PEZI|nr:hypothetical protein NUW58_g6793 [Xylaria curta]